MFKLIKNHYISLLIIACTIVIIITGLLEFSLKTNTPKYDNSNFYITNIDGKIDLNTSTWIDLTYLKGIGEVKAKAIVTYREANGEFEHIEEINNVYGIGDKTFNVIKENIIVG